MLKNGWSADAPLIVVLVVAFGLTVIGVRNHSTQLAAPRHAQTAVDVASATASEAARRERREEQDLLAQQQMADWSLGVLIATAASVLTTILGVIYVKRTLELNRGLLIEATRATAIHRQIGEAQVRAYITFSNVTARIDRGFAVIDFHVENSGNSPALEVQVSISTHMGVDQYPLMDEVEQARVSVLCGAIRQGDTQEHSVFNGTDQLTDEELEKLPSAEELIFIARLRTTFVDVFGQRRREAFDYMALMIEPAVGKKIDMSPRFDFHDELLEDFVARDGKLRTSYKNRSAF